MEPVACVKMILSGHLILWIVINVSRLKALKPYPHDEFISSVGGNTEKTIDSLFDIPQLTSM